MSFSALPLTSTLVAAVEALGYQSPTPIQSQAIPAILGGTDVMARAQTGTGKTAAFTLPMIQLLEPVATGVVKGLVLVPTRELAQQVHKAVEAYSQNSQLKTAVIYGGVSINPQIDSLKQGVDIVIATPGRLLDHLIKGSLQLTAVKFLVFDEADRMLDMGFKDEITSILKRMPANKPKQRQTLFFSATFDDAIFRFSKKLLVDPKRIEIDEGNTAAEEVEQVVYDVDKDRKRELISYLIGARNWHQVLIFVRKKQAADELAKQMKLDGIETATIHGDKSQGARDKALTEFKQGKIRALIATDVASRGIDIHKLEYVINFELPHNAEDYIHRIGRTGRAGETGLAVTLMSQDEAPLLQAIEKLLDTRLTAQWYPGYEPDLTKMVDSGRPKDKAKFKRQQRKSSSRRGGRGRRS